MGSLFGGYLFNNGEDAVLYDINREHVDAVNTQGLIIEEPALGKEITVKIPATCNKEDLKNSDFTILFVKSTATEAVAGDYFPFAKESTVVVTLQNGYGNEEIIRNRFGAGRTAAGVTSQGATFLGPGRIRHAGTGPTYLSMSDNSNEKLEPFITALTMAGFESHITDNMESLVWSKLIINIGINALTAVTGLKNGQLLEYPDTKSIMEELVNEALLVVEAKGIQLQYDDPVKQVFTVAEKTGLNRSSMLQDFDKKRVTEIDFINGAILKEAEKYNIPAPVNRTVTRLIRVLQEATRKKDG